MRRSATTCSVASLTTLLLLSVPAFAQVLVDPAALNVAAVEVGLSGSATFDVTNSGGAAVSVTDITSDDSQYSASPTAFSLDPAASQTVTVTFAPLVVGWEPADLTITHDAGGPETVSLTGIGSMAPPTGDLLADTRIAFRADVGGNFDIYTADITGGDRIRLTTDAAPEAFPTWRPDGLVVAFASSRSGLMQIYKVNADGTGLTPALTDPASNNDWPDWSPDGLRIAFESDRDGAKQLYLMDADGENEVLLPTLAGVAVRAPKWSPDGSKIAFMAQPSGDWEVYVVNVDGSGLENLTNSPGTSEESPVWHPDGVKIAFRLGNSVYGMNSDGSSVGQILGDGSNSTWSPDGTRIATQLAANLIGLWSADGTTAYPFTAATSDEQTPSWSPFLTPPGLVVTPGSLAFGSVDVGTASAAQEIVVSNAGSETLTVSAIASDNLAFVVSTTPSPPFDLLAQDPDLSQAVSVTFEPTAAGAQTANITITHNASGGSTVVTTTGTGTVPPVSVSILSPTVNQILPPETTAFTLRLDVQGHASGAWAWQLDTPFSDSGAVPAGANSVAGGNAGAMTGLADGGSHTVYVALVDDAGALLETAAIPNSRADVAFSIGVLPPDHVRVVSVQGGAGSVVTVPIEIYDITALAVTGVDIDLVYDDPAEASDDNVLTPTTDVGALLDAATPGASVVPAGWVLEQNIVSPGRLAISLAGDPETHLLGAGVLLNVAFDVGAGVDADTVPPVPLHIASLRVNEGVTPAAGVDGLFTILDIVYGDVTGDGTASALDASHVLGYVVAEGLARSRQ